tara:strand:- start:440 stop:586 length:147 start_codon:yes stop_codon:yes gene_type:complete
VEFSLLTTYYFLRVTQVEFVDTEEAASSIAAYYAEGAKRVDHEVVSSK